MKTILQSRWRIAWRALASVLTAGGLFCYRPTMAQWAAPAWLNEDHPAPFASRVKITAEGGYRVVKANGVPDHPVGAFPRRANPFAIAEQSYTFRMPLAPRLSPQVQSVGHYLEGVALDGVPFDPSTAGFWNNDRRSGWNYEAIFSTLNLGLDQNNAHVQATGAYHYHGLPTGLLNSLKANTHMTLLGYAADGFPIYGPNCPSAPKNLKSPLRAMKSSYRVKQGTRPAGEAGPGGAYDGTFTRDYEYVPKLGDLDEANGRQGVTPEYPQGTYYYVLSANWPIIPRCFKGTPDASFIHQPPGQAPAGGRRPGGPGGPGFGGPRRGRPPF